VNYRTSLDVDAIKTLRTSKGMSLSQLARDMGVSVAVVRELELGRNLNGLRLRFLERLAAVLDADLRDMMRRDSDAIDPAEDDIRVEALLTYEGRPLSEHEITEAFGWTRPRARRAIQRLEDRLLTGGTRLREGTGGSWRITPDRGVISTNDRERLNRSRLRKKGLNKSQALVLRQIAAGLVDHKWHDKAKRHELMAIRGLLEMGLVLTNEQGATVVSPEIRRSLHLA
jgi:transcriptional regulator with XRE-family HTH domain